MLYNYLIIACRQVLKHKVFSIINILGLAIGMTCCILLGLFIHDEFRYERHFSGFTDIYRVTTIYDSEKGSGKIPGSAPPAAPTFQRELPEVQNAARVIIPPDVQRHYLTFQDKSFYENRGYVVDSSFFDIFNYPFEVGNPATALDGPSPVVLSHSVAQKFFSDPASALDQLLAIASGGITDTFRVTGVLKPYTHPSQLDADFYMGMNNKGWGMIFGNSQEWAQTFIFSFVKLKPGTSVEKLLAKMPAVIEKHGAKSLKAIGMSYIPGLQPLTDMHLYSIQEFTATSLGDIGTSGNIISIYIIAAICVFILLIACINFINLTTAKAFQRAAEVGVRKSVGASRGVLIRQFLGESLVITTVAMLLAVMFAQLIMPLFNSITQKDLSINGQNMGFAILTLACVTLVTGLIAGSYPAFFLSSFQPARVLKERHLNVMSSGMLRKSLVVFQFAIAISLISSVLFIQAQMSFVQSLPLGFNPEFKIVIPIQTGEAKAGYLNLKNRFKELAGVSEVSASSALPATHTIRSLPLHIEGTAPETAVNHYWVSIDENYFDMLGVRLIQGRDLIASTDAVPFGAPVTRVLVNQASLKENFIQANKALGTKLQIEMNGQRLTYEIVGVVEDFHQFSMHKAVTPMMFVIPSPQWDYTALCVSTAAATYDETLAGLKTIWKELLPNSIFESSVLTENVKRQYDSDQRIFTTITIFTAVAIVISCLGLYGLSIFTAERKVKEIGIRKVFGAAVAHIVAILSFEYIKLVTIGFFIAIPVSYYAITLWLENFAYKIKVDISVFAVAGVISLTIAILTIGFEAVKAGLRNPVDAIRNE